MRKKRTLETDEQRGKRKEFAAQAKIDETKAADDAIDKQIKTNIRLYGA
jgi:hypothetical protein